MRPGEGRFTNAALAEAVKMETTRSVMRPYPSSGWGRGKPPSPGYLPVSTSAFSIVGCELHLLNCASASSVQEAILTPCCCQVSAPESHRWDSFPKTRFALDSPLEQRGFEPPVTREYGGLF